MIKSIATYILNNLAAIAALAFSIYAFIKMRSFNKLQEEVNCLTLKEKQKDLVAEKTANVFASLIKTGKGGIIIKIFNVGKGIAKNVNIEFPDIDSNTEVLNQKLPTDLHQHHNVDFSLYHILPVLPMKMKVVLTWSDSQAERNTREMVLCHPV